MQSSSSSSLTTSPQPLNPDGSPNDHQSSPIPLLFACSSNNSPSPLTHQSSSGPSTPQQSQLQPSQNVIGNMIGTATTTNCRHCPCISQIKNLVAQQNLTISQQEAVQSSIDSTNQQSAQKTNNHVQQNSQNLHHQSQHLNGNPTTTNHCPNVQSNNNNNNNNYNNTSAGNELKNSIFSNGQLQSSSSSSNVSRKSSRSSTVCECKKKIPAPSFVGLLGDSIPQDIIEIDNRMVTENIIPNGESQLTQNHQQQPQTEQNNRNNNNNNNNNHLMCLGNQTGGVYVAANNQDHIEPYNNNNLNNINNEDHYSGTDSGVKLTTDGGGTSEEELGPPLPPRPPPRPRYQTIINQSASQRNSGIRKYVIWCLIWGGISCLLGLMFLGVYFLVHSYTSTLETIPTFVPATLLMFTGICIMSLARRRNRYIYLINLSGFCGLTSALICALVTVTTTVLHMSRLQALKECQYTLMTRTCTCFTKVNVSQSINNDSIETIHFESSRECIITQNTLYSCLRATFGLSVAGVLVGVFSCILLYQLFHHERKKKYWEQLDLRCRSIFAGPHFGGHGGGIGSSMNAAAAMNSHQIVGGGGVGGVGGVGGAGGGQMIMDGGPSRNVLACRCCEQCHMQRNLIPIQTAAYPWDGDNRFWTPGPAGNFYSPNPGGNDHINGSGSGGGPGNNITSVVGGQRNSRSGWNWPRLPWQRTDAQRFRQPQPSSPDSQYGFTNNNHNNAVQLMDHPNNSTTNMNACSGIPSSSSGYTVIGGAPTQSNYNIWGPPPPYSDPNSPSRRGRYQYIHPPLLQCHRIDTTENNTNLVLQQQSPHHPNNMAILECHQHNNNNNNNLPMRNPTEHHSNLNQICSVSAQSHQQSIETQQQQQPQHNHQQSSSSSSASSSEHPKTIKTNHHHHNHHRNHPEHQQHQNLHRNILKRQAILCKNKDHYENTLSDNSESGGGGGGGVGGPSGSVSLPARDLFSNTLPVRKLKKYIEIGGVKSIGPNNQSSHVRVNVQNLFKDDKIKLKQNTRINHDDDDDDDPAVDQSHQFKSIGDKYQIENRNKTGGVENSSYIPNLELVNGDDDDDDDADHCGDGDGDHHCPIQHNCESITESEVYFADDSSCCNVSQNNCNLYDDANGGHLKTIISNNNNNNNSNKVLQIKSTTTTPGCDQQFQSSNDENEDYLLQRFGKREASVRSRLPFPQMLMSADDDDDDDDADSLILEKLPQPPLPPPRQSLQQQHHQQQPEQNDLSRKSICSVDSTGEKTDYTDLSPLTPSSIRTSSSTDLGRIGFNTNTSNNNNNHGLSNNNEVQTCEENDDTELNYTNKIVSDASTIDDDVATTKTTEILQTMNDIFYPVRNNFNGDDKQSMQRQTPSSPQPLTNLSNVTNLQTEYHNNGIVDPMGLINENHDRNNNNNHHQHHRRRLLHRSELNNDFILGGNSIQNSNLSASSYNNTNNTSNSNNNNSNNNSNNSSSSLSLSHHFHHQQHHQKSPINNFNITPIKRQNLGTNVGKIIAQNNSVMPGNDLSSTQLIFPDNSRREHFNNNNNQQHENSAFNNVINKDCNNKINSQQ